MKKFLLCRVAIATLAIVITMTSTAWAAGYKNLFYAASYGTTSDVKALLQEGANINARDELDQTPLMKAATHNPSGAVIEALVAAGADVNARVEEPPFYYKMTALMMAAEKNSSVEVIEALIRAGADLTARDDKGRTALQIAKDHNTSMKVINALADAENAPRQQALNQMSATPSSGMSVDEKVASVTRFTSLRNAMEEGTAEDVRRILQAGVNVNGEDEDGFTPLMYAAMGNKSPDVIDALVRAGANLNDSAPGFADYMTPLLFAVIQNKSPDGIARALIRAGADVNQCDKRGMTPLMYAVSLDNPRAIVKMLLNAGADINARDAVEWTPLMYAASGTKSVAVIKMLIKAGAEMNVCDSDGQTVLQIAKENNKSKTVIDVLTAAYAPATSGPLSSRTQVRTEPPSSSTPASIPASTPTPTEQPSRMPDPAPSVMADEIINNLRSIKTAALSYNADHKKEPQGINDLAPYLNDINKLKSDGYGLFTSKAGCYAGYDATRTTEAVRASLAEKANSAGLFGKDTVSPYTKDNGRVTMRGLSTASGSSSKSSSVSNGGRLKYGRHSVTELLSMYGSELRAKFGKPIGGTSVDGELMFGGTPFDAFDNVLFLYDNDYDGQCIYVMPSLSTITLDGEKLNKNRKALIELLGKPVDEYDGRDEIGTYSIDFIVNDGGKKIRLSFEFNDPNQPEADSLELSDWTGR